MGHGENKIKDMNLFVDGRGYAGNVDEFNPPKLELKIEDYRGGGMDTSIPIEMGMEPLETSFVLSGHFPEVLALWGLAAGDKTQLTAKGATESYYGGVSSVVINMRGVITSVEEGAWKPGESSPLTFTMKLDYYKREQDGVVLYEIDVPNMIRIINGKDQLAERRNAIGL